MYKDRVLCSAFSVPPGTHSCTYRAVAVTSGTWQVPPTKAYARSQPEVMGLSGSGRLQVQGRG